MRPQPSCRLLIIYITVAANLASITRAQCYYPGGAWAKDQFPCKYAYTSLCCPTGWTCFSNHLCIATDPNVVSLDLPLGTAIRGTCTNPAWNDTVCGDFCLNDPVSSNNGSVIPCGKNKWCCQPDSANGICNCESGKGAFQLSDGTAQTIIGVVGLQHTSTESGTPSGSVPQISSTASAVSKPSSVSNISILPGTTSATSSSKPSITLLPTSIASSKSSTNPLSSVTSPGSITKLPTGASTGVTSTDSPINTQILDTSTPTTQTTAFKAGVGTVAGVIGAIVAGLIIWFLVRRWRRRPGRGSRSADPSNWNEESAVPISSETPFQIPPNPHPYSESPFSTNQSRAALAEQIAHNRRTPRPIDLVNENNPYSDHYMAGGAGR